MARFLYRLLRVVNFVGSVQESQLRNAMRNSSVMQHLQGLISAELSKPLSYVAPFTGQAMTPALNDGVTSMDETRDRLVIRRMCGRSQTFLNRVYVDDVVVVRDPRDSRRKYVRRVAALAGDEMESKLAGDEPFQIPGDHCWVIRDNEAADAPDSRAFGPLSLENILGRVMYAIRSATDHGRVANSPYAMASDSIVLAHEPIAPHIKSPPRGPDADTDTAP